MEYYAIRKRNKLGMPVYAYHLLDWQFVAGYFNQMYGDDIREVYSIFLDVSSKIHKYLTSTVLVHTFK